MYLLGLSAGHDSGACLLRKDGTILAINEERLSRRKFHTGFPKQSINRVLKMAKIDISQVERVFIDGKHIGPAKDFGIDLKTGDWKKAAIGLLGIERRTLGTAQGIRLTYELLGLATNSYHKRIKTALSDMGYNGTVDFLDHHPCHAASAYYTQQISRSGITITMDASGEGFCSKVYLCSNNLMEKVFEVPCYYSPAYYYAYITKLLGFTPFRHEGKITGLAAYGDPRKTLDVFERFISFDPRTLQFHNPGGYHTKVFKKLKAALAPYTREDVAAGIQTHVENLMVNYINALLKTFNPPSRNLFLAGGLFANVKVNQKITESVDLENIYIFPNMGDGGICVGAAALGAYQTDPNFGPIKMSDCYLGESFDDEETLRAISEDGYQHRSMENPGEEIAKLLAEGKVVARFGGQMEMGPRALGNRSILASAAQSSINDSLNERLGRSEFMPFAPVARSEDAEKYFLLPNIDPIPFRYMTMTCKVTDHCREVAPATVHIDGTARPQLVDRSLNPEYYDILTAYGNLTGEAILVNTSFNMHEEPIVCSPNDAMRAFKASGLDFLAVGKYLVWKS